MYIVDKRIKTKDKLNMKPQFSNQEIVVIEKPSKSLVMLMNKLRDRKLMSHKLIRKGVSLYDQGVLASNKYGGKSHKCLITETSQLIKFESNRDKQNYINGVKQLKEKREDSDYHEIRISRDQSEECIKLAREIRLKINSI